MLHQRRPRLPDAPRVDLLGLEGRDGVGLDRTARTHTHSLCCDPWPVPSVSLLHRARSPTVAAYTATLAHTLLVARDTRERRVQRGARANTETRLRARGYGLPARESGAPYRRGRA